MTAIPRRSTNPGARSRRNERGSALILTLTVLIVLASLALTMSRTMRSESFAATNQVAQLQADATAKGAVEYLRTILTSTNGTLPDDSVIQSQAVPAGQGYFWIIKHDHTNDSTYSFGLTDEAGKLNLNVATLDMLSALPNMTPDVAGNIVSWRSAAGTSTATGSGADSSYYLALPTPYNAKNSTFESVEELLMVSGMNTTLLYGNDLNRNGIADPSDADGSGGSGLGATPLSKSSSLGSGLSGSGSPGSSSPGASSPNLNGVDHGLYDYVTVYSSEPNTSISGNARVNVNSANGQLASLLTSNLSGARVSDVMALVRANRPFRNVIDFYYRCGLTTDEFKLISDQLTTATGPTLTGMVNLNSASKEILMCLPNLTDADASAIISQRQSNSGITDLSVLPQVLTRDKAISIGGMVTVRSYRCSADIVAVDSAGHAFKRYLVVFDTISVPAKVLYFRDLTSLGWPLDPGILTSLRIGQSISGGTGTSSPLSNSKGAHP